MLKEFNHNWKKFSKEMQLRSMVRTSVITALSRKRRTNKFGNLQTRKKLKGNSKLTK